MKRHDRPREPGRQAQPERPGLGRLAQTRIGSQLQEMFTVAPDRLPPALDALVVRLELAFRTVQPPADEAFRQDLLTTVPTLRAFALSLTRSPDRADDLVQEALMRALKHRDRFEDGTNLQAWVFTILRNHFHSDVRKRMRMVEDADGALAARLSTPPEQVQRLHLHEFQAALNQLTPEQREALMLVGAQGIAYEDAAATLGVPVGTIKSRVNRARARLAEILGYASGDLDADHVMQAAVQDGRARRS